MVQLCGTERLVEEIEHRLGRPLCANVRDALLQVPRHLFVEQYYQQRGHSLTWDSVEATPDLVYRDEPLVTQIDQRGMPTSSSSQPSAMVVQLEELDIQQGHHLLEIGTGTGYNAALMGHMVGQKGQVVSLDIDEALVEVARRHLALAEATNVQAFVGDGFIGDALHAPYDRILATCSVRSIPCSWVEQMKTGGQLVCNVLTNLASVFVRIKKMVQKYSLAIFLLSMLHIWKCI